MAFISFTLADLSMETKLAIIQQSGHSTRRENMRISLKDCAYVHDVVHKLKQAGRDLPREIASNPLKRTTETIRCGLTLAFECEDYWRSLPRTFTYVLCGHESVIKTRELHNHLRESMLRYNNKI